MDEGIRSCPRRDVVAFFQHRLRIRHNNRLARRFYEALAGFSIEHLPLRYAATASDMELMMQVTIDRGPIIDAIEASIAIPLIARPVAHQGRYFLDGGFWDSAPVDAAVELGADVTVAVELGRPVTLPERFHKPAAWLAERMSRMPLRWTAAGMPFTIRAVTTPLQRGRSAQIVIHPPLRRFGGIAPLHMVECLDAGIKSAQEALPAIRALLAGEPALEVAQEFIPNARMIVEPGGAV
jgi:predicted acylesterase/phospholipase RssA